MCIFQSEQVIKLRNLWFYWKQRMATEFARSQTWIIMYHVSHDARMLSEIAYTPKPSNIAELKTALLSIWNDLPQRFIDKAILSFRKRLRLCVAAAGGHF